MTKKHRELYVIRANSIFENIPSFDEESINCFFVLLSVLRIFCIVL